MEAYKGPITRSKSKKLPIPELWESSISETRETLTMGDKEEINEIPENHEDRNERQILPQIRVRNIQQNILGEQHQLPMLPQGDFQYFQDMEWWTQEEISINS